MDGVIASLRAWLESVRAWVLGRDEFGWLHGWIRDADVSVIWLFVLSVIVAIILVIGFWPPLKPLPPPEGEEADREHERRLTS